MPGWCQWAAHHSGPGTALLWNLVHYLLHMICVQTCLCGFDTKGGTKHLDQSNPTQDLQKTLGKVGGTLRICSHLTGWVMGIWTIRTEQQVCRIDDVWCVLYVHLSKHLPTGLGWHHVLKQLSVVGLVANSLHLGWHEFGPSPARDIG